MTKIFAANEKWDALQQSPVLLGSIIHSVMDAIIVIDEDQHILIFNPAAEIMFLRSAEEVKGKPLTILIPKRFHAEHIENVRQFGLTAKTKRSSEKLGVVSGIRSTGEEFPLEAAISQVEVNGEKFFMAILHDIKELERTEKNLQQSLQKAERSQKLLLALSKAGNAIQRVHTNAEICQAILDGLFGLGYRAAILEVLPEDPDHLVVSYLSHPVKALEIIEKMAGVTTKGFRLPIKPGGLFDQVLRSGEADFSSADLSLYENILPKNLQPLAGTIQKTLGIKSGITARLTRGDETFGLLTVAADSLSEADLPAMTTFASQASIALDNLRLLETVRQKEEHFRSLVEQLPAVVYVDEADTSSDNFVTTFVSPQVETLLGYKAENFTVDSGLWNRLIYPEDHDRVVKCNAEHYLTRQPNRDEYRMLTHRGDVIWVRDEAFIVTSEDGRKVISQGVVFDITERKQAEETLRISENRFQGAFEYAAIGMGLVATDGQWLRVNRALCELLGYTKEELLDKTFQNITHPDDLEADLAFVHELLGGKIQSYQMEKRYFHRSGQIVWVLLNVSLIRDEKGKPLYFISQIENINDRKQAEENLRMSETRYRSLFEDPPISLWEEDFSAVKQRLDALHEDGVTDFREYFTLHPEAVAEYAALVKVVDVNKAAVKMLGANNKEDLLKSLATIVLDEPNQEFRKELINIAEGRTSFGWEGTNRTLDGRLIEVTLNWTAVTGYEHSLSRVIVSIIDITERKRAKDLLVAERDLMTTLINNLPDNIFIKDVNGRIIIDNTAHQRALRANALQQVVGKTDFDFFPRELAAQYDADEKQVVQSGEPLIDKVEPYVDEENNHRWLLTTKVPLRDRQGNITGIVGFNHDITSRKVAEEELAEERNLLRTLIDNLPDRIYAMDAKGRKTLSNLADWRASGGKTMEEVIGKTDFDIYPTELAKGYWALDKATIESGLPTINYEEQGLDAEGNEVSVLTTKVPLRDAQGIVVGLVGIGRDITERKQVEEALRRSENNFHTLAEKSQQGIQIYQGQSVVYANSAMADIMGYTIEEQMTMSLEELRETVHPLDRAIVEDRTRRRLAGEELPSSVELRIVCKDTSIHWIQSFNNPIEYNGQPAVLSTSIDVTERKQAEKRIYKQLEQLAALRSIDQVIASSFDLRNSLTMILNQVIKELGVDATDVLLLNSANLFLEYSAGVGFRTKAAEKASVRLGQEYAGRIALERQFVQIPNLEDQPDSLFLKTKLAGEDFKSYYGVPLIAKGVVRGVLEIYHRSPLNPDQEWLDFLNTLGDQATIAIDNANLFDNLQRSNIDLTLAYDATIEGWSRAMDLRDKETEGHTQRVTQMTMELAGLFGVKDEDLVSIRRGALLHDIGKMGVPDAILLKPGALTEDEWIIMRKHPTFAFEMLSSIGYLKSAIDIPYCHHEKWDGTGYPRGLKGELIPLPARIFAIVDVWDAVTSDRPYRKAWTKDVAIEYLKSQTGKHFDPDVVKICLDAGVFDRKSRK